MELLKELNYSAFFVSVFSIWIANLGVVPLFAIAVFLFLPAFFCLLILLRFNILVFDTITSLLNFNNLQNVHLRSFKYLPRIAFIVKVFMLTLSIGYSFTLCAGENFEKTVRYESLILAKGEHKEIIYQELLKFSVTNREVISHKHLKEKNKILIKGLGLGYSEVIIWGKRESKIVYQVYVLNKSGQLKILNLAKLLKSTGLKVTIDGTHLIVSGILDKYINYNLVWKLLKKYSEIIHLDALLDHSLKNLIIGDVYYYLLNEYKDEIICECLGHQVLCRYSQENPPSKSIMNFLKKKYHIRFMPSDLLIQNNNYRIKIKLIQMEYHNGSNISFGLSHLSTSISDFFHSSIHNIIENNQILLSENDLALSTLAEPDLILGLNTPSHISIGSEIPYGNQQNEVSNIIHTNWKFAGLKVKLNLNKDGPFYKLKYQTEFTKPGENGSISGSKEKSIAKIRLGKPTLLFQIGFKAIGKNTEQFPLLGNIPILGELFKSKSDKTTYKKISALIVVTKNEI